MWWSRKRFYNFDFKVALVACLLMKIRKTERCSITDCFKDVAHDFDISLSDLKHWVYADSLIRSVAEDRLRAGGRLFGPVKLDVIRAFLTYCRSYSDRYPSYVLSPDFVTEADAEVVGVPLKFLKIWVADKVLLDNVARSLGKVIDWDAHGGTGCVHDVASASGCDGRPVSVKDPCDPNFVPAAEAAKVRAEPSCGEDDDPSFCGEQPPVEEGFPGSGDAAPDRPDDGMPEEKGDSMDENLSGAGRNRQPPLFKVPDDENDPDYKQLTGSSGSASFTAEFGGVTVQVRLPGRDMSVTFGNGVLTVRAGDGSVAVSVGEG